VVAVQLLCGVLGCDGDDEGSGGKEEGGRVDQQEEGVAVW